MWVEYLYPERIERFIEGQAFLRSYDSALRPLPPSRHALSWTGETQEERKRDNLLTGGGGRIKGKDRNTPLLSLTYYCR
jgi:hypothetical protein